MWMRDAGELAPVAFFVFLATAARARIVPAHLVLITLDRPLSHWLFPSVQGHPRSRRARHQINRR